MAYCSNCGSQMEASAKFCSSCGTPVPAPAPEAPVNTAPAEPVYTAPAEQTYIVPAVPVKQAVSVKTKILGFIGMGLAIGGLFFAIIGMLYTLIGMYENGLAFGMSVAFGGLMALPMSIVGRILCNQSVQAGNTARVCSIGSKLGVAAIIVSGVMLFLGVINLMI